MQFVVFGTTGLGNQPNVHLKTGFLKKAVRSLNITTEFLANSGPSAKERIHCAMICVNRSISTPVSNKGFDSRNSSAGIVTMHLNTHRSGLVRQF